MTSLRALQLDDLFKFNALVFDPLTEVYHLGFFLRHLALWPELAVAATAPDGQLVGFIFGKCFNKFTDSSQLHGHVCSLTVSADYRRLSIASLLMKYFAHILDLKYAWYVDLFLRCSNQSALKLYCALGYTLRRVLLDYYPGNPEEDAYDMMMPLSVDVNGISLSQASRESVRLSSDDSDDDY
ncbi:N-alpha-acetyltransferase 20 [Drosophila grimshawi]|uniref:N-alpha-acetyltransferase 20 n=1 Tax=Drosophila grimshawi TaxID=7222 RepID=B4JZC4_DROGR|nr:N-alpha-acetyltransferase 20 [Drosophila grimshawi]EDV94046.1 GH25096 [Drosophila grimshawi]